MFCRTSIIPLFLLCILPYSIAFAEDQPVGKVIAITGTVEFMAAGAEAKPDQGGIIRPVAYVPWEKVQFHQPIHASDRLRTKKRSRLKVLFRDNSLMALGPNSEMSVASYLVKPGEKLRQGVINVAHGLSMYLINKSQTNKKSSFRIVSPTANLAARGTQGYVSSSFDRTLLANQSGAMAVTNSDPGVPGTEVCGVMQKTVINRGEPPLKPVPLARNELNMIRSVVVGRIAGGTAGRPGEKPLIEVQEEEKKEDKKEDKNEETGKESEKGGDQQAGETKEGKKSDKGGDSDTAKENTGETSGEAASAETTETGKAGEPGSDQTAGTEAGAGETVGAGEAAPKTGVPGNQPTGGEIAGAAPAGDFGGGMDMTGGFAGAFVTDAGGAGAVGGGVADFMPVNQPINTDGQGGGGCAP